MHTVLQLRLTGRSALPILVCGRAALLRRLFVSAATGGMVEPSVRRSGGGGKKQLRVES